MRSRAFAVALATAACAGGACSAFEATPEAPAVETPDAGATPASEAGSPDAAVEAGGTASSVLCPGRAPCSGAESACCVSTIGGAVTTCTTPEGCFFDGTHAFQCDETTDCQAGFACCGRIDPRTSTLVGSTCTAGTCGSSDALVELCRPDRPSCRAGSCTLNTKMEPKVYAFCVK